jgi:hypothetical protein
MAENFPKLVKDVSLQIQEGERASDRINSKKPTSTKKKELIKKNLKNREI